MLQECNMIKRTLGGAQSVGATAGAPQMYAGVRLRYAA